MRNGFLVGSARARAHRVALVVAAMMAAALAGCGEKPKSGEELVKARIQATLDPCADKSQAKDPFCKDKSLAPVKDQLGQALFEAASVVSEEGDSVLLDSQRQWLEATRIACGAGKEGEDSAEVAACLKQAMQQRAKEAKGAVEKLGGFTFQRVEQNSAIVVSAAAAEASGLGEDAPDAITREIKFPRIDKVGDAAAQRFNEIMAQQGKQRLRIEDQTSETLDYEIAFASQDLVSVKFLKSDTALGAPYSNEGAQGVNVLMKDGRALDAADVFKPGSGWEAYVTKRSVEALKKKLAALNAGDLALPVADVRDTATKPHNWVVRADSLEILFPPYSIGGLGHAVGMLTVAIPWADLAKYAADDAPAPIQTGKTG